MKTPFDSSAALKQFDDFIFSMSDQIEGLESLAEESEFDLQVDIVCLDTLERLFDVLAPVTADIETKNGMIVTFGRYLGEIFRTAYGGKWTVFLENEKDINFNQPVIVRGSEVDAAFAPLSVVRAYALRRKSGTLSRAVRGQIDFHPVNLEKLIEPKR